MRRSPHLAALLATLTILALTSPVLATTRIFTVTTGQGIICEIDPVFATEIFSFATPGTGIHPGLAFNGSELFYSDESLAVVKVYRPDGTFLRDLPKLGTAEGLGVSKTSLYSVDATTQTITAVDPVTGALQTSFSVALAKEALTFAGARGTMFVRVGDGAQLAEVKPDGTVLHTIDIPLNITGLAYSSSANRLFGVVMGRLYAFDPDSGAVVAGYPVDIVGDDGWRVPKTGAAAADESEPEPVCGDGDVNAQGEACDDGNLVDGDGCSARCALEFCGDGIVQPGRGEECEPELTQGCDDECQRTEICGNFADDDEDGLYDCEDGDCEDTCLPILKDPGYIRFAAPGADAFFVHGSLAPDPLDIVGESAGFLLTNANGIIYSAELPVGSLVRPSNRVFTFRNPNALAARKGIWKIDVRHRPRRGYTFRVKAFGDFSAATEALMTLQWHLGGQVFVNKGEWIKTRSGWRLELPGE